MANPQRAPANAPSERVAQPPRKHPALLIASLLLWLAWLGFLVWLAWYVS